MFQSWRLKIRESELALQAGRLEDACQRLQHDDLVHYLPGRQLAERIVSCLLERAAQYAASDAWTHAWKDWEQAHRLLGMSDSVAASQQGLLSRFRQRVEGHLQAARWQAALALFEPIASPITLGPIEQTWREVAHRMTTVEQLVRRGRFSEAEAEIGVLARTPETTDLIRPHLEQIQQLRSRTRELTRTLHLAVSQADWTSALKQADELLEMAPEHRFAKEVRRQAWHEVRPLTKPMTPTHATCPVDADFPGSTSATSDVDDLRWVTPTSDDPRPVRNPSDSSPVSLPTNIPQPHDVRPSRCLLWVDGVGGYLLHWEPEVVIGQAHESQRVDVAILANIPRRHVKLVRHADAYTVEPLSPQQPIRLNGQPLTKRALLVHHDLLELGSGVQLRFSIPHPLSTTARLEIISSHRTQPRIDGVVLMAEACVLGPQAISHIVCRDWSTDLVLYRQRQKLWIRAAETVQIDGKTCAERAPLELHSRIVGDRFSLSLEELDKCSHQPLL